MPASVEITTTQNVTIEYDLAQLRERIGAFLLDGLIIGVGYLILTVLLSFLFSSRLFGGGLGTFIGLLFPLSYLLYHTLFETLADGRTIGKMALGTKVVRLDGKSPHWMDILLRATLQLVDIISCFGIIAVLLVKTTPKAQRLGDMAANTVVIKINTALGRFTLNDIRNIASLDNYKPVYPQVRILTEQDMFFNKNALSR